MRLPETLTDEGRMAIIACLRIAAQMGEEIERAEKTTRAESGKPDRVHGKRRNRKGMLSEFHAVVTQARPKRRKRASGLR